MKTLLCLLVLLLVSCDKPVSTGRVASTPVDSVQPITGETPISTDLSSIYTISQHLNSQASRRVGAAVLSYRAEQEKQQQNTLLDINYLPTPHTLYSDDGIDRSSPVQKITLQGELCGVDQAITTVAQALASCGQAANASWEAEKNGNHGEANWFLVVRSEVQGGRSEVWLDSRTGLLWSDVLTRTDWCKASGNSEDLDDTCSNLGDSNVCANNIFLEAKGGLLSAKIAWRLPTRNDWLQADIHGARFVLPNRDQLFWSATISSQNRDQAWIYHGQEGTLDQDNRDKNYAVRCVGRILD